MRHNNISNNNKKAELRQKMTAQCALHGCPEKYESPRVRKDKTKINKTYVISNFGEKGAWAYPGTAQSF